MGWPNTDFGSEFAFYLMAAGCVGAVAATVICLVPIPWTFYAGMGTAFASILGFAWLWNFITG